MTTAVKALVAIAAATGVASGAWWLRGKWEHLKTTARQHGWNHPDA